jgi:sucrose phosphorylase
MEIQVKRFLVSQAIPLVLAGIPGIYIHSILGSRNHLQGVEDTGIARAINRQKLDMSVLEDELSDHNSIRFKILKKYKHLISCRIKEKSFHPNSGQSILNLSPAIFSVLRTPERERERESILTLHNITNQQQRISLDINIFGYDQPTKIFDLLTQRAFTIQNDMTFNLAPYEILWLKTIY